MKSAIAPTSSIIVIISAPDLFSGLVWTGEKSLELGLIDGFGSSGYVAREVIGAKKIIDFTPRDYSLEGLIRRGGVSLLSLLTEARIPGL